MRVALLTCAAAHCVRVAQSSCINLRDLDLFNCPVTEIENYRPDVFETIPMLKYLDGFDACAPDPELPPKRTWGKWQDDMVTGGF